MGIRLVSQNHAELLVCFGVFTFGEGLSSKNMMNNLPFPCAMMASDS